MTVTGAPSGDADDRADVAHLDEILAGYQDVHPLADGWRDRVGLHQLHCLLVHAILFVGGYAEQALAAARA